MKLGSSEKNTPFIGGFSLKNFTRLKEHLIFFSNLKENFLTHSNLEFTKAFKSGSKVSMNELNKDSN